jgi:hypothetical protein
VFDTEHVWTFQIYDQVMDYSTFKLPLPFFPIEVAQVRFIKYILKYIYNSEYKIVSGEITNQ